MTFDNVKSKKWIEEDFPVKLQSSVSIWLGRTIDTAIIVSVITLIAGAILNNRTAVERSVWALGLSLVAKSIQWYQDRDPKIRNETPPKQQENEKNEKISDDENKKNHSKSNMPVIPILKIPRKGEDIETGVGDEKKEEIDSKTCNPSKTSRKDGEDEQIEIEEIEEIKMETEEKSEEDTTFDLNRILDDSSLTPIKKNDKLRSKTASPDETSMTTEEVIKESRKERPYLDALLKSDITEDEQTPLQSKVIKVTDEEGKPINITFNLDKLGTDSLIKPKKERDEKIPEIDNSTEELIRETREKRKILDELFTSDDE